MNEKHTSALDNNNDEELNNYNDIDDDENDGDDIEEKIQIENIDTTIKLDYLLKSSQERTELVAKIVDSVPQEKLTPRYLEILSDYIIAASDNKEELKHKILTDNRMVTVNKRETSFEGLVGKFENGEDGIYNILSDLGKNTILSPKDNITEKDVEEVPGLKELRAAIARVEESYKKACGKQKFLLKKQIIEMRQDQYVLRSSYRGTVYNYRQSSMIKTIAKLDFWEDISFDENENPINKGLISFFNPAHVEALLCNYSGLRMASEGKFEYDLWHMMEDLDRLVDLTLKDNYPLYYDLLIYKIDGKMNIEIQQLLEEKYGIKHSVEYISSLWRNKIPKLIADSAQEDYIMWYYTYKERGKWKKCSRCGEVKLAHNRFFSKNKTSKDGYYSICKCCRNAKSKKK